MLHEELIAAERDHRGGRESEQARTAGPPHGDEVDRRGEQPEGCWTMMTKIRCGVIPCSTRRNIE